MITPPAFAPVAAPQAFDPTSLLPDAPNFELQSKPCAKCNFYQQGTFLSPVANKTVDQAKLIVVVDSPDKRDVRGREYLASEPGQFLMDALEPYGIYRDDILIIPVVRCMLPRGTKLKKTQKRKGTNATNKEARLCWRASGAEALMHYYQTTHCPSAYPKRVLALGYWPVKLLTDRLLTELHGQVMQINEMKVGCHESPTYYYNKFVKWQKDADGRWEMIPPNGERIAHDTFCADIRTTVKRLFSDEHSVTVNSDADIQFPHIVVTEHDNFLRRLQERENCLVHLDVETYATPEELAKGRTALDWFYGPECCMPLCMGVALFDDLQDTNYNPNLFKPDYDPNKVIVYRGDWSEEIATALHRSKLYAFNATYDTGVVLQHTGVACDIYADPCDMAYVLNQRRKKYSLDSLCFEYLPNYAGWGTKIKEGKDYVNLPVDRLCNYNAGDNVASAILFFKFKDMLTAQGLDFVYWEILAGTKTILRDMEARGVRVDTAYWQDLKNKLETNLANAGEALHSCAAVQNFMIKYGKEYNPQSGPQTLRILRSVHGDDVASCDKTVLKKFVGQDDPFAKALLDFRSSSKAHGIYVKTFSKFMQKDWNDQMIVYPAYKTNTTETGRTSSGGSDVTGLGATNQINIQNVPRDGGLRKLFIARKGYKLGYADYGQIEVRVTGAYAHSEEILAACHGADFHGTVASKAFRAPFEEIMAEAKYCDEHGGTSRRTKAKTITFGLIYGMTADGLAARLGITPEEAQKFIDDYFAGMPSVQKFINETQEFVKKNFYVRTVFGRYRYFDAANASALREGTNTLVQATASDIFLLSNRAIKDVFTREGAYMRYFFPWAEVHDSITNEFHSCMPDDEVSQMMEYAMTTRVREMFPRVDEFLWKIPLSADVKILEVWH